MKPESSKGVKKAAALKKRAAKFSSAKATQHGPQLLTRQPRRAGGVKADINIRFYSKEDYEMVKRAAYGTMVDGRPLSMSRFIVEAAIAAARAAPAAREKAG